VQNAIATGNTACGSCHASSTSRYVNDAGQAYVLAGAQHDALGPQITAVAFTYANVTAPIVTWTTDKPATSYVEYLAVGRLTPFQATPVYTTTVGSASLTTTHSVSFPAPTYDISYYYRIKTVDAQGNVAYSTGRQYVRYRSSVFTSPSLPEPTMNGLSTDQLMFNVMKADGSTVSTGTGTGWQSQAASGTLPTPSAPGAAVASATVRYSDSSNGGWGSTWKTNIATTDRAFNWQLSRFQIDPALRATARSVGLSFAANGDVAAGHPVVLYIWDFQSQTWVKLASREVNDYYYNVGGMQRYFTYNAPTDPQQAFCIRCHTKFAPAGVTMPGTLADISQAWGTDAHGDKTGHANGYGGTLKAPYVRGQAAIPCATCHQSHGSTNLYHLNTTVNGSPVSVKAGTDGYSLCSACHVGTANDFHAACITCHLNPNPGGGVTTTPYEPTNFIGTDCFKCHKHGQSNYVPVSSAPAGCAQEADCHSSMNAF
jgi:hypothetical protein